MKDEGGRKHKLHNSIKAHELAFDIDGVVADTMAVFVRLARERRGLTDLTKDHLRHYDLHQCLDVDRDIVDDLICMTLDDENTRTIPPVPGAIEVLTELSRQAPLRFVTARIWPESIIHWLQDTLANVPKDRIHVIATGAPEAKLKILQGLNIKYFVEDRLETCRILAHEGLRPLLFDQPWNRAPEASEFTRVESWPQLGQMILPQEGN